MWDKLSLFKKIACPLHTHASLHEHTHTQTQTRERTHTHTHSHKQMTHTWNETSFSPIHVSQKDVTQDPPFIKSIL